MAKHFVEIDIKCPRCGQTARRAFTAESRAYALRLSSSSTCSRCLFAEESDGPDISNDARTAFYAMEGCWSFVIDSLSNARFDALGSLRAFLGDTPAEFVRRVKDRRALIAGTLVEIEQIAIPLAELGVAYSVNRVI